VALATLLSDLVPIFYSQLRCGLNGGTIGRNFQIRSMVVDGDKIKSLVKNQAKGNIFKCTDDLRITPLGKFLRGTS
jgi:lipopolysaccharide/colanic/teichoic acid biosynthesis glycosyltransferase